MPLGSWRWTRPGLGVADRQVAVGAPLVGEDLDVRGAVHGLEAHRAPSTSVKYMFSRYTSQWPDGFQRLDVVEDRRLDLAVAARGVLVAPEAGELRSRSPCRSAARTASRGRARENRNRSSSRPSLRWSRARASSSRWRYCLEVLLGVEGGAVDPREHLAVGVAAPVRAGDRQQLERLDALGRRRVRAAAEVGERRRWCRARPTRRRGRAPGPRSARPCSPAPRARSARARRRRETSSRSNGSSALTCSRILASIASKSCSETVTPSGNSKS